MIKVTLSSAATLNGGDAAIVEGARAFLKWVYGEQVEPWVIDDNPDVALRYYELNYLPSLINAASNPNPQSFPAKAVRHAQALRERAPLIFHPSSSTRERVANHIRSSDLLAATGGTYLVDHYAWWRRLPEYETAMRGGVPLVFLTQSMGPLLGPASAIRRLRRVLEYATKVLVRDQRTAEVVHRIAPGAHVVLAPDLAFALARQVEAPQHSQDVRTESPRIAVSVREWPYFKETSLKAGMDRYRRAVASSVSYLVRQLNASVTFVSTCQGVAEYRYDDSHMAAQVWEMLEPDVAPRVEVDRSFTPPIELIKKLSVFDLVISTRMHGAILSWIAGTPVVAVAYEPKTADLFTKHNLEELVHHMETLEPRRLVETVADVLGGADRALSARKRADAEALALTEMAAAPGWPRVDRNQAAGK